MEKKDVWLITSLATVTEKVVFDKPVTKEKAISLYSIGQWHDVMDFDLEETQDVIEAV